MGMRQIGGSALTPSFPMLIASRTLLHEHREIAAIAITYGLFATGTMLLAWVVA